jgi:nitrogen regulatory protein P-II 2
MKYIIAIIQPGKLTAVHDALLEIGITGMTCNRSAGLWTAKGQKRDLSRCRIYSSFLAKS